MMSFCKAIDNSPPGLFCNSRTTLNDDDGEDVDDGNDDENDFCALVVHMRDDRCHDKYVMIE